MKNYRLTLMLVIIAIAILACMVVTSFAADSDHNLMATTNPDYNVNYNSNGLSGAVSNPFTNPQSLGAIIMPMIAVLVPLAVAGIKKIVPNIPSPLLPIAATLLGLMATLCSNLAGATSINPMWGLLLGAAGVGVREIKDQVFPAAPLADNATKK